MRPYVVLVNRDENVQGGDERDAIAARDSFETAEPVRRALSHLGEAVIVETEDGDPETLARELRAHDPRVVFNLAEAARGASELEAAVAALLDLLGLAYTGNGPKTLALCLDKPRAKALLAGAGVTVPEGIVVRDAATDSFAGVEFPAIVKPACLDASHGIEPTSVVRDERSARERAAALLARFGGAAIVERFIDGRELNVSVFEAEPGKPEVLALSEIDFRLPPEMPRVVGYDAKWVEGSETFRKTPVICPAKLPEELERRVRELAITSWEATGCRDYARVDVRVDRDEQPFVLEVNPNPCLSPGEGFARSAKNSGWSYDDLIRRIATNAERRGPAFPARAVRPPNSLARES